MSRRKKGTIPMNDEVVDDDAEVSVMPDVAESLTGRKKPVRKQKYYALYGVRKDNKEQKTIKTSKTVGQAVKYFTENELLIGEIFDNVSLERCYVCDPRTGKVLDAAP